MKKESFEKQGKKDKILGLFNENADISKREFIIKNKKVDLYFIDCLINKEIFSTGIVSALKLLENSQNGNFLDSLLRALAKLNKNNIPIIPVETTHKLEYVVSSLLRWYSCLRVLGIGGSIFILSRNSSLKPGG